MSDFIDINRLDYINPEYIYLPEEFSELEKMHGNYRDKAVKFLIKNNLKRQTSRNHPPAFMVFRIYFCDLWEWHIPEKLSEIIEEIKSGVETILPCKWDCVWILKITGNSGVPVYFCDIVIFLPDQMMQKNFRECLLRKFRNSAFVSEIKYLDPKNITAKEMVIPTHYDMFEGNLADPSEFLDYAGVKYPGMKTMLLNPGVVTRLRLRQFAF